ncbi:GNAT family N-acetyltransferase [Deinococcus sp. KSM4-11]|uniref:GNAT family N-acetyltransferase n=1 Tax=Deinococcus sp. KSM4-11 TaxID=2568654 RepID=UPI0010A4DBB5|nr:GNAT family N-acetyltransferase [Deinococcus sp. KSM4-11]THF86285.1 GNAT family N-acetyltransferase [Deinococcus sp. KSM4-11]
MVSDPSRAALLAAYDAQLREDSEMASADAFDRAGPLYRGVFGDRGFVTYRDLGGLTGSALDDLIAQTVEHYAANPQIKTFEWKTRGHDAPADLPGRLIAHGLTPDDLETVMVGEAKLLAQPVPLPEGVTLRRIDNQPEPRADVERAAATLERAFGHGFGAGGLLRRIEQRPDLIELWVAEAGGEVISAGRLEYVPDSDFAGLWGGGTLPEWRGQGIYRALTAARASSAADRGVRYLHSDCTAMSRPILERSGMIPVTTTTPYLWRR